VYRELGRTKEALSLLEDARTRQAKVLGPNHPNTRRTTEYSATCLSDLGRDTEARELIKTANKEIKQKALEQKQLALSYVAAGQMSEALPESRKAYVGLKSVLGSDHPETARALDLLAYVHLVLGQLAEALPLYEEAVTRLKITSGPDDAITLNSQGNLGDVYRSLGRHRDALPLLEHVLAIRVKTLGPDHRDSVWTALRVVETLVALNRTDEAWSRLGDALNQATRAEAAGKVPSSTFTLELLLLRLQICRNRRDAAGVRETAELLRGLPNQTAQVKYTLASGHVVLAGLRADDPAAAKAEADRAMEWLTKAVAAGYRGRAAIEADATLEALRDRDDFRKLVASLR
jgi:tetratricopeptide (TPR) repeat protein